MFITKYGAIRYNPGIEEMTSKYEPINERIHTYKIKLTYISLGAITLKGGKCNGFSK